MGPGAIRETNAKSSANGSWLDDSLWPILVVTLPPSPSDEDMANYLKQLASYRQRREPYGLVVDTTHALFFTPRQRKMQADYIREGLPLTRLYLKGIAYVAESALKRGGITAVHWLTKPPAPHEVFGTKAEALEWLAARLRNP